MQKKKREKSIVQHVWIDGPYSLHYMFQKMVCWVERQHIFLKRLGDRLAVKWERGYSEVMSWIRARLSFAVLRASILCLRASRTKWRSVEHFDGAPLALIMT